MCGIVGMVAKKSVGFYRSHEDIFTELLYADALRGDDSTGVFSVTRKNDVRVVKQAVNPGIFCGTQSYLNFKQNLSVTATVAIGHNRKASVADVSSKNAHPFVNGSIALVHNGFISNHKELDKDAVVDSEAIITVLNQEEDPLVALSKLHGAYALVWYNHKTKRLFLARNKERPLAIAHTEDYMFIASEVDMLEWILTRNGIRSATYVDLREDLMWKIALKPWSMDSGAIPKNKSVVVGYENWPMASNQEPDVSGLGPTYDPPMTELARAQEMANQMHAANWKERPDWMAMQKRYPYNSDVLFLCKSTIPNKDTRSIAIRGIAWVPGLDSINAQINMSEDEDEELYIDQRHPLMATVAHLVQRNTQMVLMLKNLRPCQTILHDVNKACVTLEEWHWICKSVSCHKCGKDIHRQEIDYTNVTKTALDKYEVTCANCETAPAKLLVKKDAIPSLSTTDLKEIGELVREAAGDWDKGKTGEVKGGENGG
jgi:predicted glutamine amidotransferase